MEQKIFVMLGRGSIPLDLMLTIRALYIQGARIYGKEDVTALLWGRHKVPVLPACLRFEVVDRDAPDEPSCFAWSYGICVGPIDVLISNTPHVRYARRAARRFLSMATACDSKAWNAVFVDSVMRTGQISAEVRYQAAIRLLDAKGDPVSQHLAQKVREIGS